MTTPIYTGLLGLDWGPRGDALDDCTERAYRSMERLRAAGYATPSSGILQEQAVPATPAPDKPALRKIG